MQSMTNIMDVTVRDGSYAVGFRYSIEHVKKIVSGLIEAGVEWIEIGHGLGFGAGKIYKTTDYDDRRQIEAVAGLIKTSGKDVKTGVIGMPDIFKVNELQDVAGMISFVRLACDVASPGRLRDAVPACRKMGLKVFVQMMRSSAVAPKAAAKSAKKLAEFGADVIYVVDTAGCMIPGEPAEYVKRVKCATKRRVGFHAHNNLQLALANTLEAVRAGASFVDASIHGMGRSSGNAAIEKLVAVLRMSGSRICIDEKKLISSADELLQELFKDVPRAPASDAYFAMKKRDFLMTRVMEMVAGELGLRFFDLVDDLARLPAGVELTIDDLGKIIESHGRDAAEVYKKIGIA